MMMMILTTDVLTNTATNEYGNGDGEYDDDDDNSVWKNGCGSKRACMQEDRDCVGRKSSHVVLVEGREIVSNPARKKIDLYVCKC